MGKKLDNLLNTGKKILVRGLVATIGLLPMSYVTGCHLPDTKVAEERKEKIERQNSEEKKTGPTEGEVFSLVGLMGMLSGNPKDAQLGSLLYNLGQMEHDKEVAREGRSETEINIYNQDRERQSSNLPENVVYFNGKFKPAQGYAWINPNDVNDLGVRKKVRKTDKDRFISYNKWVDLDRNGTITIETELFGLGKKVFDIDKERMTIGFYQEHLGEREISFRSWTPTGELLGETIAKRRFNGGYISQGFIGPKQDPTKPEFLEKIKSAGSGDYIITVNTDEGKTYMLNIKIIKEKNK